MSSQNNESYNNDNEIIDEENDFNQINSEVYSLEMSDERDEAKKLEAIEKFFDF